MSEALNDLAAYLKDQSALNALTSHSVAPGALVDGQTYCEIVPWDLSSRRAALPNGWGRREAKPPEAFIFLHSSCRKAQGGVIMGLERGRWTFRPAILSLPSTGNYFIPLQEAWAETLCRLSAKTLDPLIQFRPSSEVDPIHRPGLREIKLW